MDTLKSMQQQIDKLATLNAQWEKKWNEWQEKWEKAQKETEELQNRLEQLRVEAEPAMRMASVTLARQVVSQLSGPIIQEYFSRSVYYQMHAYEITDFIQLLDAVDEVKSKQDRSTDEQYFLECFDSMFEKMGPALEDREALEALMNNKSGL